MLVALVTPSACAAPADPEGAADRPPAPQRSDFPTASTTGVPPGAALKESGSIVIDTDGAVIDRLAITGTVTVTADDVTIRRTRITSTAPIPVLVSGANLVIEDVEIDGSGLLGPAVAYSGYTLLRVHVHNIQEGPRIAGGDVRIEDSLIDGIRHVKPHHADAVQIVGGSNILIKGNSLNVYDAEAETLGNAAFQFGEEERIVRDCVVSGNYLNGGNYTINGGGGGTRGAACAFADNSFGTDFRYGVVTNLGPSSTWDGTSNVWLGTWTPVPVGLFG